MIGDPFGHEELLGGNILLGGLPRRCGVGVVVNHLSALERLGALANPSLLSEEFNSAMKDGIATATNVTKDLHALADIMRTGVRGSDLVSTLSGKLRRNPSAKPTGGQVLDAFADATGVAATDFQNDWGIVAPSLRPMAAARLLRWVGERLDQPGFSLVALIDELEWWERERWSLPEAWESADCIRLSRLHPLAVALGVHELVRTPWSMYGGLVVERAASAQYLEALWSVDREVLRSYVVLSWYDELSAGFADVAKRLDDVVELTIAFPVAPSLVAILRHASRAYLAGEYGVAAVLARSALESAVRLVWDARNLDSFSSTSFDLATQIRELRDRKEIKRHVYGAMQHVKNLGNEAVHGRLSIVTEEAARKSLAQLALVIRELRPDLEVES